VSFRRRRRPRPPQTGEVSSHDDAERFFFDLESVRPDHRVRSLCRQAQEAVLLAMAEVGLDSRLDGTFVASVDPAPGPERLLVTVVAPPQATTEAIEAAFAALAELRPALRAEVARAIHRKRVPDLAFRVAVEAATVPPPVVGEDGNAEDGNGDDVDED